MRGGGADGLGDRVGAGPQAPRVLAHLGQVVLEEPEARVQLEVDAQDDPPRRHPAQLGQAGGPVVPVVHGEDGQRDVGAARWEREGRAAGPDRRRRARRTLAHHDARGSTAMTARSAGS